MKSWTKYLFCLLLPGWLASAAQSYPIDSLLKEIKKSGQDTMRVKRLNKLGSYYLLLYNYTECLKMATEAGELAKKLNFKRGQANAYNLIGSTYWGKGNVPKALEFYFTQLKISEEINDHRTIGKAYHGIGLVYSQQGIDTAAIRYFTQARIHYEKANEKVGTSSIYNNIGQCYQHMGDYAEALKNMFESLKIKEEIGDKSGEASCYNNMGIVYDMQGDDKRAIECYQKSVALRKEMGQTDAIAGVLCNLGAIHLKLGKYGAARGYLRQSLEIGLRTGNKFELMNCYQTITQLDSAQNDFKGALINYKLCVSYRDSMINEDNIEATTQKTMQYEFDKQQTADSLRNLAIANKEQLKHEQVIQQEQLYTWGGGIGFVLMLVVAGVSFNAFNQKKKANAIISHQKSLVEEKQKEILDSIHYAKRIQQSLLPTEKFIHKSVQRMKGHE